METTIQTLNEREAAKLLKSQPAAAPAKAGPSARAKMIAAGALGALLIAGGAYYFATRGWVSTDDASIEGHIVPVSAKVQGHIVKVLVADNQTVARGDVLAELDSQDY